MPRIGCQINRQKGEQAVYNQILLAIDHSEYSRRALQEAVKIASASESKPKVTILHVIPGVVYAAYPVFLTEYPKESLRNDGEEILQEAKKSLAAIDVSCETVLKEGDAATEIQRQIEGGNYDLVVMGSRGTGAFGQFILGSVSRKVLHIAGCPVLVVK